MVHTDIFYPFFFSFKGSDDIAGGLFICIQVWPSKYGCEEENVARESIASKWQAPNINGSFGGVENKLIAFSREGIRRH